MFQGSRNVKSGEHFSALMAEGGRLNATTWFDRTNYFETIPKGALELALWLEADRHGHLLDAVDPGEPRQPARRRQGGEAAALRQRALRQRAHRRLRHGLPRRPPVPPPDDRVDGGPRRREPRGRPRLLPPLLRPEQLGADHRRRHRAGGRVRQGGDVLRVPAGLGPARRRTTSTISTRSPSRPGSSVSRTCPTTGCTSRGGCPWTATRTTSPAPWPSTSWVGSARLGWCNGWSATSSRRPLSTRTPWVSSTVSRSGCSSSTSPPAPRRRRGGGRRRRGDWSGSSPRVRPTSSWRARWPRPSAPGSARWPARRSAPT